MIESWDNLPSISGFREVNLLDHNLYNAFQSTPTLMTMLASRCGRHNGLRQRAADNNMLPPPTAKKLQETKFDKH